MKRSILPIVMAVLSILLLDSCTHRLTDFTVISTKNVPIGDGAHANFKKGNRRVSGKDTSHMILFFPTGMPNMKDAIDRAIEQTPGAIGLVDGVVKSSSWYALLYGQNSYIVEGTPLFVSDFEEDDGAVGKKRKSNNVRIKTPVSSDDLDSNETMIFYHNVKDGETLVSIAQIYGVKVSDIIKWNKLSDTGISKGDKLTIKIKE